MAYEYQIKQGFVVLAKITGEDRKETVNRAVRQCLRLQHQGYKPEVHGVGPDDWALVDSFPGWEKATVQ